MKHLLILLACSVGLNFSAAAQEVNEPLHLDPEMTGREYLRILTERASHPLELQDSEQDPGNATEDADLNRFLEMGKKNLDWVDLVNSQRTPQNKISLSSQATQGGNPVSLPRFYNFQIIKEKWQILQDLIPAALKKVVFDGAPITAAIPLTDREFSEWLFQVDSAYQIAARYKLMRPSKLYMTDSKTDIRGYVILRDEPSLNSTLQNWTQLENAKKDRLTKALVSICHNSGAQSASCRSEVDSAVTNRSLVALKDKYMSAGKSMYDSYFVIRQSRSDVEWTAANNVLSLPFTDPDNTAVLDFLRFNIEDEYRWNGWNLRLNFVSSSSSSTTHVEFVPGSTPHVNGLAGSTITMDANAPLSEYDVQWTIRHEFGHVLGFPDCYHESYDLEQEAFMSYQLDVTNLMCSRRGHFKQLHFDELKRVYAR